MMSNIQADRVEAAKARFLGKTFLVLPEMWHSSNVMMNNPPSWHPECGFLAVCASVSLSFSQVCLFTEDGQSVDAGRCVTLEEYLARSGVA